MNLDTFSTTVNKRVSHFSHTVFLIFGQSRASILPPIQVLNRTKNISAGWSFYCYSMRLSCIKLFIWITARRGMKHFPKSQIAPLLSAASHQSLGYIQNKKGVLHRCTSLKQQKHGTELNAAGVLCAGSDIVMIECKSGRACKAVSYIYDTIMSRLPKSYKCVDASQRDKPLPSAR